MKCSAAAEQSVPDSAQTTYFESQSTAGNLHILLADVIGRWVNSQFPEKMRFKILGGVNRVIPKKRPIS